MRGKERTHEASPESSLDMIGSACQPTQTACAHMLPTVPELLLRDRSPARRPPPRCAARLEVPGIVPASERAAWPLSEVPGVPGRRERMLLILAGAIVGGTSVVLARRAWPRLRHLRGPMSARLSSVALASLGVANQRPLVLGLTGSIGMGKSTASEWWRRAGIRVHDSDATVHALYGAGGAAVEPIGAAFGGTVIAADGGIDRAALSQAIAVAGREQSFKTLEKIVHPLVSASRAAFVAEAEAAGEWLVVVDVPLLFETNPDEASLRAAGVDAVLVMSAPEDVQVTIARTAIVLTPHSQLLIPHSALPTPALWLRQVARVLARPGMTREKLQVILARQTPDAAKRARADYVVETEAFSPARAGLARCLTLALALALALTLTLTLTLTLALALALTLTPNPEP